MARIREGSRLRRAAMAAYVALVAALALVATADPNELRLWAMRAVLVLCLPATIAVLPVLYVVVSTMWNITDADAGGVTWPVTSSYVAIFTAAAVLNCLLIGHLLDRQRATRRGRVTIGGPPPTTRPGRIGPSRRDGDRRTPTSG